MLEVQLTTETEKAEETARLDVAYVLRNAARTIGGWDDVSTCISRLAAARLRLEIERGTLECKQHLAQTAINNFPLKPGETFTPAVIYSDRDIEMFARGMHSEGRPSYHWANASDAVKHAYISVAKQRLGIVFDGRGRPGEPRA